MLEEPSTKYICSHFRKYSSFLRILLTRGIIVVATVCAIATSDTGVTSITYKKKSKLMSTLTIIKKRVLKLTNVT